MAQHVLVRLAVPPYDPEADESTGSAHVGEFVGATVEEAVAKALAANAETRATEPNPTGGLIIQQFDFAEQEWRPIDWWRFVAGG